jgi:hypothetical protein
MQFRPLHRIFLIVLVINFLTQQSGVSSFSSSSLLLSSSSSSTSLEPYCYREIFNNKLVCSNFTSFRQLNFRKVANEVFSSVEFEPEKSLHLRLDADLSLAGLQLSPSTAKLTFRNIFDFDFFYNPFLAIAKQSNGKGLWLDIRIIDSQWLFSNLPTSEESREVLMNTEDEYFLSGLNMSLFLLDNCKILSPIHSSLFRGSTIREWIYQSLDSIKYEPRLLDDGELIDEYIFKKVYIQYKWWDWGQKLPIWN